MARRITINVGVMGHVDSGKTSLVRKLSTVLSTAALDKNPQSKERGITLDLGFSSLMLDDIEAFKAAGDSWESPSEVHEDGQLIADGATNADAENALQPPAKREPHTTSAIICLVDCPGHATLIKTVLNAAHIIDMVLLVIDITKGFQTQTSECLVIAEIMTSNLIVVLNKVDLIPPNIRANKVERLKQKLVKLFERTTFGGKVPMVATAAEIGSNSGVEPSENNEAQASIGIGDLLLCMRSTIPLPHRSAKGPFYFAYDHSFAIKGQGTIVTGTVLSGAVRVGQSVMIPAIGGKAKIRSMQMFKEPIQNAQEGDRVALCLPTVDASKMERGLLVDTQNPLPTLFACIAAVERIRGYKPEILNNARFHCTVGHHTLMCVVNFFADGSHPIYNTEAVEAPVSKAATIAIDYRNAFNLRNYEDKWPSRFNFDNKYVHLESLPDLKESSIDPNEIQKQRKHKQCYAVLRFEKPIQCPLGSIFICSKLDVEKLTNACRIAFYGKILHGFEQLVTPTASATAVHSFPPLQALKGLKRIDAVKLKEKLGHVDQLVKSDACCIIARNLFKNEQDESRFTNCRVEVVLQRKAEEGSDSREQEIRVGGVIERAFGNKGKCVIRLDEELADKVLLVKSEIILRFVKSVFDKSAKVQQIEGVAAL